MAGCSIQFDDFSLSRKQCSITYDKNWILMDGDGNKASTNGTWYSYNQLRLFVEDFFEIKDNMIFKAGQSLFVAKLLQNY